ncbi:hypothetical protein [Arthrobacter antioxidans]|uniref:hypothetical protein n=1 Tax=Arthrobacter antioxidans TaxID=2895818 RepID=UPI001FFF2D01|nr:hypothetical protein [Arthrobacter antioxidans]
MTSEQPHTSPDQPDPRGDDGVPADGRTAPGDRPTAGPDAPVHGADPVRPPSPAPAAPAVREVTVRRAPKFVPFMLVGAVLGFLAALVLAYTGPEDPTLTRESVLGFFTVAFALPGLLLAALLVLVIDRRSVRRAERARAERTDDA